MATITKTQAPVAKQPTITFSSLAEGSFFERPETGNVYVKGNGVAVKVGNVKTSSFRQRTVTNPDSYFSGSTILPLKNANLSVQF